MKYNSNIIKYYVMENLLKKLNLTENEIAIYLWLLRNGENTAAAAARGALLDKSSAYRAAENLYDAGLLIKSEKVRGTEYAAESPEVLKSLLNAKRNELNAMEGSLGDLVDVLKNQSLSSRNTLIRVEKGYDAHVRLMELSLAENTDGVFREFWTLDNPIFRSPRYTRYLDSFIKRRLEKNIKVKYLAKYSKNKPWSRHMNPDPSFLKEIRLIPEEFENNNGFKIYGDYAEILSFSTSNIDGDLDDVLVITIKDKIIVKLLKDIFDFIWNRSEIYTEKDFKEGETTFNKINQ